MKKSELKAIITEMAERIEELEAERGETVTITFPPITYPPVTYPPVTYPPPFTYEHRDGDWWSRPAIWWSHVDGIPVSGSRG